MENGLLGFVMSGKYRVKTLEKLKENNFSTPTQISSHLEISLSQASRTLLQLQEKGLVECTTPDRKKGRIYRITDKGISVIKELDRE